MSTSFGSNLRFARERHGWSQTELARRTGFKPSAISHFETGRRSPSMENLCRLCDAMQVSSDWLMGLVDSRLRRARGEGK